MRRRPLLFGYRLQGAKGTGGRDEARTHPASGSRRRDAKRVSARAPNSSGEANRKKKKQTRPEDRRFLVLVGANHPISGRPRFSTLP